MLVFLPFATNVDEMAVSLGFKWVSFGNCGCDGRFGELMNFNTPIELRFIKILHSILSITKGNHYVDSVGRQDPINFAQHLIGIGIGSLPTLLIRQNLQ